jgi:CRP-like cAMP-binding protein
VTKRGKLLNLIEAGECIGEMAYLSKASSPVANVRSADVTTMTPVTVIKLATAPLSAASLECRNQFDRAFLKILVDRLTFANDRLTQERNVSA